MDVLGVKLEFLLDLKVEGMSVSVLGESGGHMTLINVDKVKKYKDKELVDKIYEIAQAIRNELTKYSLQFKNHLKLKVEQERMACTYPCCMFVHKIEERIQTEEKEARVTIREQLKQLKRYYTTIKKRQEENSKSIRKMKNIYQQFLPKITWKVKYLQVLLHNMQRKYSTENGYFGYVDRDGYDRCRQNICFNGDRKMNSIHKCHYDCIKEMMDEQLFLVYGYSASYTFTHQMQKFLKLVTHNEISHEEWLQCYDIILATTKEKKDWLEKNELILPQQIHNIAKKLKMDMQLQTDEEKENGHSMFLCDLADCKLCAARR